MPAGDPNYNPSTLYIPPAAFQRLTAFEKQCLYGSPSLPFSLAARTSLLHRLVLDCMHLSYITVFPYHSGTSNPPLPPSPSLLATTHSHRSATDWAIKKAHFDCVVFFQKGKFYELYEDDADVGARELDLKACRLRPLLAGRWPTVPSF